MQSPALKLNQLSKTFGKIEAVKQLSFSIEVGEMFALLGPNGAGKSTTINMISGQSRVGSGKIEVFGHDNQSEFELSRRLTGVMPQELVFDNFFTVNQSLKIHSGYYGYQDDPKWRETLIQRLSLEEFRDRKPMQLSGGTKRRLMLAKALIHKPRLLILDEPTAGVDVELRQNLWTFVKEINKMGTTILLTTHYLEEAQEMCERVAIMRNGELAVIDKTSSLLKQVENKKLRISLNTQLSPTDARLAKLSYTQLGPNGLYLDTSFSKTEEIVEILERSKSLFGSDIDDVEILRADLEDVFLNLTRSTPGDTHG